MPRPRKWPPTIHHNKANDVDRIRLYDANGEAYWENLGKHGSPEVKQNYRRILQSYDLEQPKKIETGQVESVMELAAAYLEEVVPKIEPTTATNIRYAFGVLLEIHADTKIEEFGSMALKQVRDRMLNIRKWEGRQTNRQINRIRAGWKWAASMEMIPEESYARLMLLEPLRRSDYSGIRWYEEVEAVSNETVEATLPFMPRIVADMVRLQLLSGARPGEVIQVRPCDVERPGLTVEGIDIWIFQPEKNKKKHRGKRRTIPIGPKAQVILLPYLDRDPEAYCFSPREVMLELGKKVNPKSKRCPGVKYLRTSYTHAIAVACKRAKVPSWHPHQLRHSAATLAHEEMDLDHAQAVLGHDSPDATKIYSHAQLLKAAKAIAKLG